MGEDGMKFLRGLVSLVGIEEKLQIQIQFIELVARRQKVEKLNKQ